MEDAGDDEFVLRDFVGDYEGQPGYLDLVEAIAERGFAEAGMVLEHGYRLLDFLRYSLSCGWVFLGDVGAYFCQVSYCSR